MPEDEQEQEQEQGTFDAESRLVQIGGKDYLQVQDRLLWLRTEAPDSQIETSLVEVTPQVAIFRAEVIRIIDGVIQGKATGYGSETPSDFRDYIEKAETKAIGRALGALGYGTVAAYSDATLASLADAPAQRPQGRQHGAQQSSAPASTGKITQKQVDYIWTLAGERGKNRDAVHADNNVASLWDLNSQQGSDYIKHLMSLRPVKREGPIQEQSAMPDPAEQAAFDSGFHDDAFPSRRIPDYAHERS